MKFRSILYFVFVLGSVTSVSGQSSPDSIIIEHQIYHVVKIGTQEWLAENLNVSVFANGDAIPEAKSEMDLAEAGQNQKPAWCYYKYDSAYAKKYGKLYNWYAVHDKRGLAPKGWHVPTNDDWNILYKSVGGFTSNLKSKKGWDIDHGWKVNGNGNNSSGFSALPGGSALGVRSDFKGLHGGGAYATSGFPIYEAGNTGAFWSDSKKNKRDAWYYYIGYSDNIVLSMFHSKANAFSVRCVKDK